MCLVSFIPTDDGFYLSSNRDESPLRDTSDLVKETIGEQTLLYPADHKGGSWILISDQGRMVCLLNGAFQYHKHAPPYRMSRGIMCKRYFEYSDAIMFYEEFVFWGIEPFTMIIYEGDQRFYEFRWDGSVKYVRELDSKRRHVWSSSTLYTHQVREIRKSALLNYLEKSDLQDGNDIVQAHLQVFEGNEEKTLLINRDEIVRTISHTQVRCTPDKTQLSYFNLLSQEKNTVVI